jgi:hypothetical protein
MQNTHYKHAWDDMKEPGPIGKLLIGTICVVWYTFGALIVLALLCGLGAWLWSFIIKPETILPYLGNLVIGFFYMFSWWIALISCFALFGPENRSLRGFWKVIWAVALLASVLCIIDSFGKPSHGHMEYSEHSQQWVEDDPE